MSSVFRKLKNRSILELMNKNRHRKYRMQLYDISTQFQNLEIIII